MLIKRDVRKAGEEGDWKKKTIDRGWWKRQSDEAVKNLRAARCCSQLLLTKGKRGRERERDGRNKINYVV